MDINFLASCQLTALCCALFVVSQSWLLHTVERAPQLRSVQPHLSTSTSMPDSTLLPLASLLLHHSARSELFHFSYTSYCIDTSTHATSVIAVSCHSSLSVLSTATISSLHLSYSSPLSRFDVILSLSELQSEAILCSLLHSCTQASKNTNHAAY